MNFRELADDAGLEEIEFIEMVELFVRAGMADIRRIEAAVLSGSMPQMAEAAHSLKGAAANFGFQDIFETARELESLAIRNAGKEIGQPVRLLKASLNAIVLALESK